MRLRFLCRVKGQPSLPPAAACWNRRHTITGRGVGVVRSRVNTSKLSGWFFFPLFPFIFCWFIDLESRSTAVCSLITLTFTYWISLSLFPCYQVLIHRRLWYLWLRRMWFFLFVQWRVLQVLDFRHEFFFQALILFSLNEWTGSLNGAALMLGTWCLC